LFLCFPFQASSQHEEHEFPQLPENLSFTGHYLPLAQAMRTLHQNLDTLVICHFLHFPVTLQFANSGRFLMNHFIVLIFGFKLAVSGHERSERGRGSSQFGRLDCDCASRAASPDTDQSRYRPWAHHTAHGSQQGFGSIELTVSHAIFF
jgi:hypothetical protein